MTRGERGLLLRAALASGGAAVDAWRAWRRDFSPALLGSETPELLPLLAWNLRLQGIDDPLFTGARATERAVWIRNTIRMHELARVLQTLRADGVDTMVLKGAALVALCYPDPGLRPMFDVDVLVPHDRARATMALLARAGWRAVPRLATTCAPEETIGVRHSHPFENTAGEQLDLHWHVLWECCEPDADDDFWRGSVPIAVGGAPTRALGAADQLLHVCVHGALGPGTSLRWVVDAAMVLAANGGAVDWDRLVTQAQRRRLVLPVRDALGVLVRDLDTPIPASVTRALTRESPSLTQRIEHAARRRAGAWWRPPVLLACHHWRLSAHQGLGRAVAGFPGYLRRTYGVEHVWQLRSLLVTKARDRYAR